MEGKSKVVFKINRYYEENYNIEEIIKEVIDKNKSLDFYGKFLYTHPKGLENGAVEYIEILFKKF